jgi:hypothetical protein
VATPVCGECQRWALFLLPEVGANRLFCEVNEPAFLFCDFRFHEKRRLRYGLPCAVSEPAKEEAERGGVKKLQFRPHAREDIFQFER